MAWLFNAWPLLNKDKITHSVNSIRVKAAVSLGLHVSAPTQCCSHGTCWEAQTHHVTWRTKAHASEHSLTPLTIRDPSPSVPTLYLWYICGIKPQSCFMVSWMQRDDRGQDGWMASPTQWTWVWVDSGSWWWTGRPGVLRFMGSQRVRHDWETELNWMHASVHAFTFLCKGPLI